MNANFHPKAGLIIATAALPFVAGQFGGKKYVLPVALGVTIAGIVSQVTSRTSDDPHEVPLVIWGLYATGIAGAYWRPQYAWAFGLGVIAAEYAIANLNLSEN